MSKVLIVTDEEIAKYALAHQQILLDKLAALAEEYPNATKEELFEYARRELTINPAQISLPSHKALTEMPALTAPPKESVEELPVAASEYNEADTTVEQPDNVEDADNDYEGYEEQEEETPVVEEPVVVNEPEIPELVEPVAAYYPENIDFELQEAYNKAIQIQQQLPLYGSTVAPPSAEEADYNDYNNSTPSAPETPSVPEASESPDVEYVQPEVNQTPGNIAFRQKKFKGLFQEASKLDH